MSYWSKLVHWFTSLGGQSFEPTLHICSYFFIFLQASATQFKTGGFIPSRGLSLLWGFSFTDQALNLPSSLGQPQRSHPWSFVVGPDFFFWVWVPQGRCLLFLMRIYVESVPGSHNFLTSKMWPTTGGSNPANPPNAHFPEHRKMKLGEHPAVWGVVQSDPSWHFNILAYSTI